MCDRPAAVMLFAAGFGTRMGALTATRPKPLIPVRGITLFDHALRLADHAGIARKVANAHYHAGQIVAHLADRPDVAVSVEQPEILETGGGLRAALPLLGEGPVFTLNTDAVWTGPNPLRTLSEAWDPARMDALLLVMRADRVAGGGGSPDFTMLADGRLGRGGPFTYLGAQIVQTAGLLAIEDRTFSLNRLWDSQIAAGRLFGLVHPGGWCDVGRPEGIAVAEDLLAAGGHV